jgi:hypothetical protein
MNYNLFTQFYVDPNPNRQLELEYCLRRNIANSFGKIVLFIEKKEEVVYLIENGFLTTRTFIKFIDKRATFNDMFAVMDSGEYADDYNIMANTDIFFTEGLTDLKAYTETLEKNICVALSRYDYQMNGYVTPFHRADSQDTWGFFGNPFVRTSIEFGMGMAGCDNRLAHEIVQHGYQVVNPCSQIATYHLHQSNVRNYLNDNNEPKERIPPPYVLVKPQ